MKSIAQTDRSPLHDQQDDRAPKATGTELVADLFSGNAAANRRRWWAERFRAFVPGELRGLTIVTVAI